MSRQYELNKELAQMLKGGVIMMLRLRSRQRSLRQQVRVLLWHWRESRQIFVQPEVYHV